MIKRVITATSASAIAIMTTSTIRSSPVYAQGKKDHHDGNKFKNPWPSFIPFSLTSVPKMLMQMDLTGTKERIKPSDLPQKVDVNWNLINKDEKLNDDIAATWMGQ